MTDALQIGLFAHQCWSNFCPAMQALEEWEERERERQEAFAGVSTGPEAEEEAQQYLAYVPLPDQKEIEVRVMEKKKADLLAKYASDTLVSQQQDVRSLLNKR